MLIQKQNNNRKKMTKQSNRDGEGSEKKWVEFGNEQLFEIELKE